MLSAAAFIAVLVWIHDASTTVRYLRGVTMSPSTVVVLCFVPIVNLWMPFKALIEIDRASSRESDPFETLRIQAWQMVLVIVFVARAIALLVVNDFVLVANGAANLALCVAVFSTIRAMEPKLARMRRRRAKSGE